MAYLLKFTYLDSQKNGAFSFEYNSSALTEVAAVAESGDIRDTINALTDCTLGYRSVENVLQRSRVRPTGNVDGEKKAQFAFTTAAGKIMLRTIPGFKSAKFIDGTDLVDLEDTDVAAYVSAVVGGTITDSNASDINGIESAVKQFSQRQD